MVIIKNNCHVRSGNVVLNSNGIEFLPVTDISAASVLQLNVVLFRHHKVKLRNSAACTGDRNPFCQLTCEKKKKNSYNVH